MDKLTYLAAFEPNSSGGYSVYFPDLPGCVGCGDDYESAYQDAVEALALHLYGMMKDGDPVPASSKNPKVEPETAPGFLISPIGVYPELLKDELDNKAVKTNITLPQWLKDWANSEGINLSQTLQTVLKSMHNSTGGQ
jgi:predicted RNase H-like HicB family nuclease